MRCHRNIDLVQFLLNENDQHLAAFIIDYAKQNADLVHSLDDSRIRQKFAKNLNRFSWNNHKQKIREGAIQVGTSVVFTSSTWLPRSIHFDVSAENSFGPEFSSLEADLRMEGLDETVKALLIDKLTSEEFLKRVLAEPEKLVDALRLIASKLNYAQDSAKLTLSFRVQGNEVFYSNLDTPQKLVALINGPRQAILYKQIETINNILFATTQVSQPLVNGFTFRRRMEVSISAMLSKDTVRDEPDLMQLTSLFSGSTWFANTFEVSLNCGSRISLRKTSVSSARFGTGFSGIGVDGNWVYSSEVSPIARIPLITVE